MRKIFFIIIILFANVSCSPNEDEATNIPTLDGLFELKLNMSESKVREVVDAKLLKKKESSWENDHAIYFYLESYAPKNGFLIEDIELSFAYDKLYSIDIRKYNAQLEELLTLKCGEPNVESRTDGSKTKKTWNTNCKSFDCYSTLTKYASSESYELRISTHIVESVTLKQFANSFLPDILLSTWILFFIIAVLLLIIYVIWIKKK